MCEAIAIIGWLLFLMMLLMLEARYDGKIDLIFVRFDELN
jgi:hypothetical protein